jgi:glycine/D-amino acid oxidase-like deaminating enzyme
MPEGTGGRADVAIVGGALMGSSTAHFLKTLAPSLEVVVVEPDPTYEFASSVRASGGARRLFSCRENIEMSNFSIPFIRDFAQAMAVDGERAEVEWKEGGYLFIVPPSAMEALEANHAVQVANGVEADLLTPARVKERFPSMRVDDLGGGVHSPRDGWCDPSGLLQGFRRKARSLGVEYLKDRVVALSASGSSVVEATLASGARIRADAFVNATGAWSGEVAAMAGMRLPVAPMRRFEHFFSCATKLESLPYVKDLARLAFRPEAEGYSGGLVAGDEPRGFNFEVDHGWFERAVWPALAHRFPAMEAAKCRRTWSGLYEQCELDGNPIIGPWRDGCANLYTVAGFSGHGMMHAPAAGRAIAELILFGAFRTIDLARFGYERVVRGEPYAERGIV